MCPIVDGTPVNASTTNAQLLDAVADDTAEGKLTLANTESVSGPSITNIQREHNSIASFVGKSTNSVYNALPSWSSNDVGSSTDAVKTRADNLSAKFNVSSGHSHDGSAGGGKPILAGSIASVPLKGFFNAGTALINVSGTSLDITSEMNTKTASTGSTVEGVVSTMPYNRVILKQAAGVTAGENFEDGAGNIVYGRITFSTGVWTLSFYSLVSATETAYSFPPGSDIFFYYQELYNPLGSSPVYSELAFIPSDNITADVLLASTTQAGKVSLDFTASGAINDVASAASSAGTPNGVVANANHWHQGVHSVRYDTDPQLYGDVVIQGTGGITISQSGQTITFNATSGVKGWQETLAGTVDGINDTFGPLSKTPVDSDGILVFVNGLQRDKGTAWGVSGSNIVFNAGYIPEVDQKVYVYYLYSEAVVGSTVSPKVEYRTISSGEAASKSLTLSQTPSSSGDVILDVVEGSPQFYGTDYSVSGSTLSWNGLGLDGVLTTGDRLRIQYFY